MNSIFTQARRLINEQQRLAAMAANPRNASSKLEALIAENKAQIVDLIPHMVQKSQQQCESPETFTNWAQALRVAAAA